MLSQALAAAGIACAGFGLVLRSREGDHHEQVPTLATYRRTLVGGSELEADRLWYSIESLRAGAPDHAADRSLSGGQKRGLLVAATVVVVALILAPNMTGVILVGGLILAYFASLVFRLVLFARSLNGHGTVQVPDEILRDDDVQLPTYSVLVPAYGEPAVLRRLVENLRALDYPADRLEILLLLEEDDEATVREARRVLGRSIDITLVLVPASGPRTKPKALNYGLMVSTGQLIAIYDAEDRPEPLQLRRAALALGAAPENVACVQARLDFFNPTQNLLTRWFTLDYRMWFTQLLPGLSQMGAPIPLGGTSNHFRRSALVEVGAWDPRNVTEDADLGLRLHRAGYRVGVVESTTYEEANSDLVNWVKQRSRWYKGYAQTALVHLRHPRELHRDLGTRSTAMFLLVVVGTPLLAILNPIFWGVTLVWFIWHPHVIVSVIPTFTYFVGLLCWVGGNLGVLYTWILSTRQPRERLWLAALISPFYWILMAVAAVKALVQLVTDPSYWEKTEHGLGVDDDRVDASEVVA